MIELLTYRVESHEPKMHNNLLARNNQLEQQKERACCLQKGDL